jgi:hypothetical protein
MNVGKSPGARPLLFHTRSTGRLAQHPTLGNEHNMSIGKLFLEFSRKSGSIGQINEYHGKGKAR